ncbi:Ger(x)C family spore germination protein [Lysinibacillus piscis]|nr:Ger(x)C family spore germination protein [Lysinibacillus sp. KH24]
MKKWLWCMILLVLLLYGCAQTNILERIGLTTLIGYDVGKEKKMQTTAVIREVNPEFQSKVDVITTEDNTSKGNRMEVNRRVSKKVMIGQMRVILFGEALAEEGLHYYIDASLENASVNNGVYTAIVKDQVAPLLEYDYQNIEDIGQHIYRLLEQNIQQEYMISSMLHEVGRDYYAVGRDMAMPIIEKEEELIKLSGIALFKDGKMVSTLPPPDSFYVKVIRDTFKSGIYETTLQSEDLPSILQKKTDDTMTVAFDAIRSKRTMTLVDAKNPEFDLTIKLKARVLEVSPSFDQSHRKSVEALEKAIQHKLTKELARVIAHSQKVESDVFGFGEEYRSHVRHAELTKEKWHSLYKNMKVNIHVDFVILRNGVFE